MMLRLSLLCCSLLLLLCATGAAQDTAIVIRPESVAAAIAAREIPRVIADEALRRFNAPTTTRLFGRTRIPAANSLNGDLGILGGPVNLAGRVRGTLLVINGDLELEPGAVVEGDVFVVGGAVFGADRATIRGELREYREILPVRRTGTGDELAYWEGPRRRLRRFTRASHTWETAGTSSTLTIATAGTFNRIEGVPIVFGPLFDWRVSGTARWRLDALGIFRSAGNLSSERGDLGYHIKTELRVGEVAPQLAVGARLYDQVAAIESWQLKDAEIGWTAFILHRDHRDYFLRKGVAGYVRVTPDQRLSFTGEVRRGLESSVAARDPWTLFRNDQPWRANPAIDDGHYTTVGGTLTLDTRNDHEDPTAGWWVQAAVDRTSSRDAIPQNLPTSVRDSIPPGGAYAYTFAWIDLRRYSRISPSGRVNLRFLTGGWLGGDPLAVQRRLSIGGPDPLSGHLFRASACNPNPSDPAATALCDRVALFQVEYRGHLSLRWKHDWFGGDEEGRGEGRSVLSLEGVDLVVFGDAGQAWLVGTGPGRVPSNELAPLDTWRADVGLGVDAGGLGLYVAKALSGPTPLRVTFRLDHRF